ncbi:MAG: HAD-IB family hydrolase, partial [Pseudomonadota bacterium]
FDMDRTLTRSGTWSRYLFSVNKARPFFYLRLPLLGAHAVAYKLGFASRQSVKEHGLKTLMWAKRKDLERAADQFAETEVRQGLRRQTVAVLDKHRSKGDTLVMATAAADLVACPIAEKLGFQTVISTELEWSENDHLTGKLAGPNCYGLAKLQRIRAADEENSFQEPTTGYSDHISDLPFLQWVDIGVAVNPSQGLARVAHDAGLRVEDWDKEDMGNENA